MRKVIYSLILLAFISVLFAGNMIINKTNGEQVEIPLNEIENITFENTEAAFLEQLIEWMTGDFSSEEQAETSSDPYHVDVRLRMVRIWDEEPVE